MAPWGAFIFGGLTGVAVCVTIYIIYKKYYEPEKPHKHSESEIEDLKTIEDLKNDIKKLKKELADKNETKVEKTIVNENSGLRHRNVQKRENIQQINAPNQQSIQQNRTQNQEAVQQALKKEIKTAEVEIQTDFLPLFIDDEGSVASPSVSTDSVSTCSFTSDITIVDEVGEIEDLRGIKNWDELGDAEKAAMTCPTDENPIETVTEPCGHAFMCGRCAPVYFKMEKKCPVCRVKIDGFYIVNGSSNW